jgi:small subunit ribosomal protein S1
MKKIEELLTNKNWTDEDWLTYESESSGRRRVNRTIKLKNGDRVKVYSHAPDAQEVYERYYGLQPQLKEPSNGDIVSAQILSVNEKTKLAILNVGWREDAILDLEKESKEYLSHIQVGNKIDVQIEAKNPKANAYFVASYSKNIQAIKRKELFDSIGGRNAYPGKVEELIHGGYFINIDGIRCFMPGSLGGMNKLVNFESLLGQTIYVVPINYSKDKDYIVVSHREYLKSLVPQEVEKLIIGQKYQGFVTGTSKHGVFVEFNQCLTGLISKSDLQEDQFNSYTNGLIKPGDSIEFFLKEVLEDTKIILSCKPETIINEWDGIEEKYKVPSVVTGKVKRIVKYGIFVELEPKIVGLLHKSQLNEDMQFEVGQEIDVKIVKIDRESKKLDFTV